MSSLRPGLEVEYDSAKRRRPLLTEVQNIRDHRGLLKLLVVRDLTVRYKRSVLGLWWTLLNPLLTSAIMWLVFGKIFRFATDVPFIVYLLSGVLLATYFVQGVMAAGSAIVNSAAILTKVYVPPEIFSLSAAIAAGVNFGFSLLPLLIIQVAVGVGIPWTAILIPIPALAMLGLVTGLGLMVAAAAVYFYDVLDLTAVVLQLVGYLTPSFYPIAIIPENLRIVIEFNPVYHFLVVFRHYVYMGSLPPARSMAVMLATGIVSVLAGATVFSRSWKRLVVVL